LVGAILGQPSLADIFKQTTALITASGNGFEQQTIVHKGQTLGSYQAPWGPVSNFKSTGDLSLLIWKGHVIQIINKSNDLKTPVRAGSQIGILTVKAGDNSAGAPLELSQDLPSPSWHWRIFRK
jgi:D-alanyl-D-alanine carboxypeptidase (penicillin-binding protein 5/6)